MKNLLYKEFRLATPLLTFLFLVFSIMTFLPGYPILCGAFFICFGIFQSYQFGREDNDILYSVLLPVSKSEVVKSKYIAAVIIQFAAFLMCTVFTVIRMIYLSDAEMYTSNVLMGANPVFLAFVLLIFMVFNVVFIGGFFKTAYGIGKPFILFIVVAFLVIGFAETLHHLPGLDWLNALDFSFAGRQMTVLSAAFAVYIAGTVFACKISQKRFERIDL